MSDRQLYLQTEAIVADVDDIALYVSELRANEFAEFMCELGRQHYLLFNSEDWAKQVAYWLNNEALDMLKDLIEQVEALK